jgi:Zn-dependent peptidase ImmA (M78 family)
MMSVREHLTPEDLTELGASFVMMIGVQHVLGHQRASSTADDYIDRSILTPMQAIVRDAFAVCILADRPDERERLAAFVERYGLLDVVAEAMI